MNKDKEIVLFEKKSSGFEILDVCGRLPFAFQSVNSWVANRKSSKHNQYLKSLMTRLGMNDDETYLLLTHATSVNDTFWVKSSNDSISWNHVSLYRNEFSDIVSKIAYEGFGIVDVNFSTTSPEFSSPELAVDGSYRKCFRKERETGQYGSDIFIYKREGIRSSGYETYAEILASEIAQKISPDNAVQYQLRKLHGNFASCCNLFTSEQYGYAGFGKVSDVSGDNLDGILEFYSSIGSEQYFRELVLIDALTFNTDRHTGNHGVLFDNDTLEIFRISPAFDFNLSMLSFIPTEELSDIGDRLVEVSPVFGEDFTQMGQKVLNDALRERLESLRDFSFAFRGNPKFPEQRIFLLEQILHKQAEAILSEQKLYTKDVFVSQKLLEYEELLEKASDFEPIVTQLYDAMEEIFQQTNDFSEFLGTIETSPTNACYVMESFSHSVRLDFVHATIHISRISGEEISVSDLKLEDRLLYEALKIAKSETQKILKMDGRKSLFHDVTDSISPKI